MTTHRTIRGIDLAFDHAGSGQELIVFIHGVGADRTSWAPQVKYFSEIGYSVAAVDMRGSGLSQSRDENGLAVPITMFDFAADVSELIHALGFEQAYWIGNSMGGVIILEAFRQNVSTIARAVLCNTFAKHPDSAQILPRPAEALKTRSLAEFAKERIPFAHRQDIDSETLNASIQAMAAKDVETYLLSWRETWSHDYRSILPNVSCESLVVTGSLDKITPPALGKEIAGMIPNAKYHEILAASHLSNLDQPEEFNRVVSDFLKA